MNADWKRVTIYCLLQKVCKHYKIKANQKKTELQQALNKHNQAKDDVQYFDEIMIEQTSRINSKLAKQRTKIGKRKNQNIKMQMKMMMKMKMRMRMRMKMRINIDKSTKGIYPQLMKMKTKVKMRIRRRRRKRKRSRRRKKIFQS